MAVATQKYYKRRVSVPADKGSRADRAITIGRPVEEVYGFWRKLDNLPRFMRHLDSVTVKDELHSHWVAKLKGERTVEWDAEIIEDRPNEVLSWRSMPDSELENAGSVWFSPAPGGRGTVVRISIMYRPPAGKVGKAIGKLLGRDAEEDIGEDLLSVKSLLEAGEIPRTAGQPRGGSAKGGRR
jgi:uncharacterized membrane protein